MEKYINVLLIKYSESKVVYFSVCTGAEFDLLLCKTSFLLVQLAQRHRVMPICGCFLLRKQIPESCCDVYLSLCTWMIHSGEQLA